MKELLIPTPLTLRNAMRRARKYQPARQATVEAAKRKAAAYNQRAQQKP